MHELALTEGILSIVASEQRKNHFSRVRQIRLRIGEYSGVIPSCIEEYFPLVAKGSAAEEAELVLETVTATFLCSECGYLGPLKEHSACCPACGSSAIRMETGREFYVESLVVDP